MKKTTHIFLSLISVSIVAFCGCASSRARALNRFQAEPITTPENIKALEAKYVDWELVAEGVRKAGAAQKTERNATLSDLMRLSDHKYEQFKTKLYVVDAGGNSIIDITSIGLSAAATFVGGSSGQILSGADTALKGAQGKLAERWLSTKTMRVLLITMDSTRALVRTSLFKK